MFLGIDASSYLDCLDAGAHYYKNGIEIDPLALMRNQGVEYLRIRLWKDPRDKEGHPYGGGNNDYAHYKKLAQLGLEYGYKIVMDPHFSDFWCDPGKQTLPKGWEGLSEDDLLLELRKYANDIFSASRKDGIYPAYIQLGNEITNGMLWPYAKLRMDGPLSGYDHLIKALNVIAKEARVIFPKSKLIVHLENSSNNAIYREFFDEVASNVDFDCIGMSYYPFWHGTFLTFFANVEDMINRYSKDVLVMETGYAFTMKDYLKTQYGKSKLVINPDLVKKIDYDLHFPFTPAGQAGFIKELRIKCARYHVAGLFYWEPFWLPLKGATTSSSLSGLAYTKEEGKITRNEWANMCLFDYDGNALQGIDEFALNKKED